MSYDFEKYNDGEPFDFRQEKWMEEAEKRIQTNNALEDYAIDDNGYMYVRDNSGNVSKVHASKVNTNR